MQLKYLNLNRYLIALVVSHSCLTFAMQNRPSGPQSNDPNRVLDEADRTTRTPGVSPARRIDREPRQGGNNQPPTAADFRSIDGSQNNLSDPDMGKAHSQLQRFISADYGDGIQTLSGQNRVSARLISNTVLTQAGSIPNPEGASDFIWQWGQFLDHDIDLTDGIDPPQVANIDVPAGDPWFDPNNSGSAVIAFNRSIYDLSTGTSTDNPRQQINEISSWIDASNVYGSDSARASALRTLDGTGRMKTSAGNLLPFNVDGFSNAGGDSAGLFLAGDVRANEQVGLTAMHTLFVREHNWHADRIRTANPQLNGEDIYQRARQMVNAEIQVITYREYLPALLGRGYLSQYQGYQPEINATIANVFSSAAFRYGHSALSPALLRLNAQGNPIPAGHLALRDAFFAPQRLIEEGGIAPIMRGLANQVSQAVDNHIIDDVRNFLFGPPGAGGFDLAALNIQRGRDHGLPAYNTVREAFGLQPALQFSDISSDPDTQNALASVYPDIDDIDVWVGGLAEDPMPGALVGELVGAILKQQFEALRDGDRFWYLRVLNPQQLDAIRNTRLSDIIRRNTVIGNEIADDVFHVTTN
ncbi:MAG: peroxidase family protein [Gammaproteobacteria bacterium]|nr:peroxidase family protein [Gammaproteobacteria bacterium]